MKFTTIFSIATATLATLASAGNGRMKPGYVNPNYVPHVDPPRYPYPTDKQYPECTWSPSQKAYICGFGSGSPVVYQPLGQYSSAQQGNVDQVDAGDSEEDTANMAQQLEDTYQSVKSEVEEKKSETIPVDFNPTEYEVPISMAEWNSWTAEKQGATTLILGFVALRKDRSQEVWDMMSPGDQIALAWKLGNREVAKILSAVPQFKAIRQCIGMTCQSPRGLPPVVFPDYQS